MKQCNTLAAEPYFSTVKEKNNFKSYGPAAMEYIGLCKEQK